MWRGLMISRWLMVFFLLAGISACNLDTGSQSPADSGQVITTTTAQGALSCSASVPTGVTVISGQPTPILVVGSGGTSPYYLAGTTTSFSSNTTITRSYSNTSNGSIVVSDQVTIEDSTAQETTCTFNVTVQPESAPPANLACTLLSSASTVVVNGAVTYTATSTGGVSPRTLYNFSPGSSATTISPFNPASGMATVSYTTTGQKTASVQVSDNAGNTASCSAVVQVVASPSLTVTVAPSTTQPAGGIFTLTAVPSNFISPPTSYSFVPSSSQVTVNQSNSSSATAQVSSTTLSNFQATVTASNSTQTASYVVSLTYTNSNQLTCTLSHPSGTYNPGDTVTFTVTANTGESLVITQAVAQDGTGYYVNNTANIIFSSTGNKTFTVLAQSRTTGQRCNGGNAIQDTVTISPVSSTLSCTVSTNINPANSGQYFIGTVVATPNSGFASITDISTNLPVNGNYVVLSGGLRAQMYIFTRGKFLMTYTIRDSRSGAVARCTDTQTIR